MEQPAAPAEGHLRRSTIEFGKVIVENVPVTMTRGAILEHLTQASLPARKLLLFRADSHALHQKAILTFSTEELALMAVADLDNRELGGSTLSARHFAQDSKLLVWSEAGASSTSRCF